MVATLRQPKWIVAGLVVALLAALFVRLGFWQLSRLEERRIENAIASQRLGADPVQLQALVDEAGDDLASIEYRRVLADGVFDVTGEVLIRSQVDLGQAGFHVITPLFVADSDSVLVNRGWAPLTMDNPPVAAEPQPGRVEVEGWIHLTETRPPLGAEEPPGDIEVFNRVDIDRIGDQLEYDLADVYIVSDGSNEALPLPVDPPDFSDEGPHLAYAIQWFGFALVGLVGFFFLVRARAHPGSRPG